MEKPRERTPEDKARDAATAWGNLQVSFKAVSQGVADMETAVAAGNPADWATAKKSADAGLAELDWKIASALEVKDFATDDKVKKGLDGAEKSVTDAKALVKQAPAEPKARVPVLTCADALLAILPPEHFTGPAELVLGPAEKAVADFFEKLIASDIEAFEAIWSKHQNHEITRRFGQFGKERRARLLALFTNEKFKARARGREAEQKNEKSRRGALGTMTSGPVARAPEPSSPAAEPTPVSSGTASAAGVGAAAAHTEPMAATARHPDVSGHAPKATTTALTPSPVAPRHTPEPRGPAIAARVPGVTYEDEKFCVATPGRHVDVTMQRVPEGAPRSRRGANNTAVLEIPTGLGDAEFADAVAPELRALHEQLSREPVDGTAGGLGSTLPQSGTQSATLDATMRPTDRIPLTHGQVGPLPADVRGDLESAVGISLAAVTVHADERGRAVAAAHGARAVAIDADIFIGESMLEADAAEQRALLAHEVAHVAQARGARGTGRAPRVGGTEAAENEANRFATMFAEGGSAAKWQPTVAVSPGTAMHAPDGNMAEAVKQATAEKPDVAWAYLRRNEEAFIAAMADHIRLVTLVKDPRLGWVTGGMAAQFPTALRLALGGNPLFIKLQELVWPGDPWFSIDLHRPLTTGTPGEFFDGREPEGGMEWQFLAGDAVATDVQKALQLSLQRMLPRYVVQLEAKPVITVADLVTSHPMDVVTANLLCDPAVLKGIPPAKEHQKGRASANHGAHEPKAPDDPRQFKDGVRFLNNWRWLGDTNPKLWNWLEALDPLDATPEEVAASLWMDPSATKYSYAITQSGRFFRLEAPWARKFVKDPFEKVDGPDRDNALDLAESELATDAAISQAAGEKRVDKKGHELPADFKGLGRTLKRSERQLRRAKDLLPDPVWENVLPALHWVQTQADWIAGMTDNHLVDLTPVIEGQSDLLFEAVGSIAEVANTADVKVLAADPNSPITKVLREYAIAAGESHLIESARAHMVRARAAKVDMPLALLDISARATSAGVDDFIAQGHGDWAGNHAATIDINRRVIGDLRHRQANGEKVDEGLVSYVAAQVKEQSVDVRTKSLYNQLSDLGNLARDSRFGFFETMASLFDSNVGALSGVIFGVMEDLQHTVIDMHATIKKDDLKNAKTDADKAYVLENATRRTEKNLTDFVKRNDLERRMKGALAIIEKQERRTTIIKVITQIIILIGSSVSSRSRAATQRRRSSVTSWVARLCASRSRP